MIKEGIRKILVILVAILGIIILIYPIVESRFLDHVETNTIVETFKKDKEARESKKDSSKISIFEETHKPIGILYVPEIDVILPIYNEVSEYALSKGAGALPTFNNLKGEEGSICAISSHNGLSASGLFTNLDKLKKGSNFYIEPRDGKIIQYKVVREETVDPTDSSLLQAEKGKAKALLISCASIEGINSHRLLVIGEKIGQMDHIEKGHFVLSSYELFVIGVLALFLIILLVRLLLRRKEEHEKT